MRPNEGLQLSHEVTTPRHYWLALLLILVGFASISGYLRYEPHHVGVLAMGWPHALPYAMAGVLGGISCLAFYSITQSLWNDTRFSFLASLLLATSTGGGSLLTEPSLGLYLWVVSLIAMAFTLRWWMWRSGNHASPVSRWHPWDIMTGIVLGTLGAGAGLLPLLWVSGTVVLWFNSFTRKRFSLREWWESYQGITLSTGITLLLGCSILLIKGGIPPWGFLMPTIPLPLNTFEWLQLFGLNIILLGFPWFPISAYCLWNLLKHWGYFGKSGKLYGEESQTLVGMLALWSTLLGLMLLVSFWTKGETTFIQLGALACMALWIGYGMTVASRFLTLSTGLQLMLQGLPLFLLLFGVASSWNILTQLPDTYLEGIQWAFPGVATLQATDNPLMALISLPFWKMGLLAVPFWCLLGSIFFTVAHAIRGLSLYRTVVAFGVWGLGYGVLLHHVQWPISHPIVMNAPTEVLSGVKPPVCCGTLPLWDAYDKRLAPQASFNTSPLLLMMPEVYYYTHYARLSPKYQAIARVLHPYWGLTSTPWLAMSLVDIFPLYAPIPQSNNRIILRLKTGG
jgi:hypothetical protein